MIFFSNFAWISLQIYRRLRDCSQGSELWVLTRLCFHFSVSSTWGSAGVGSDSFYEPEYRTDSSQGWEKLLWGLPGYTWNWSQGSALCYNRYFPVCSNVCLSILNLIRANYKKKSLCKSRSDYSYRSSLIRVFSICKGVWFFSKIQTTTTKYHKI